MDPTAPLGVCANDAVHRYGGRRGSERLPGMVRPQLSPICRKVVLLAGKMP